ncbi:cupin domain-containing protein [Ruicaihuangia caeni]|uniref:Cupin domain-containing protein n=1 Tax=Ruicaihuangia caeni TaxID=3042517 RepID=A0AAW6T5X5_9MICO|nr:cupin domain-containing protein [Klugiella sp. YN-L-19]MDI2098634.1 cupin domain-containing protein [Klugiella sp. YN-L-19]
MTERRQADAEVQLDDDTVRVTRWRFAPGTETGWHTHELDYVVVPVTDGALVLNERGADSRSFTLAAGASYTRTPGTEHNIVNESDAEVVFVEVEVKR